MPTDAERREMARSLRELSKDTEEVSDFDLAKTLGLESVSRCGYAPEDVLRLADLIEPEPERTCRLVPMPWNGAPPYRRSNVVLDGMTDGCPECGYPIKARLRETPNYCPFCGAKVVEDVD